MRRSLTNLSSEFWAVQKRVNIVDLVKSFQTSIYLQKSASIQPRTGLTMFAKEIINSLFFKNTFAGKIWTITTDKWISPQKSAFLWLYWNTHVHILLLILAIQYFNECEVLIW